MHMKSTDPHYRYLELFYKIHTGATSGLPINRVTSAKLATSLALGPKRTGAEHQNGLAEKILILILLLCNLLLLFLNVINRRPLLWT